MLFRRLVFGVLIRAAQNPAVQKKVGEMARKALKQARPSLLHGSRRAGELTQKAKQKLFDAENQS